MQLKEFVWDDTTEEKKSLKNEAVEPVTKVESVTKVEPVTKVLVLQIIKKIMHYGIDVRHIVNWCMPSWLYQSHHRSREVSEILECFFTTDSSG